MAEPIYAPIISAEMTLSDALRQVCKISRGSNKLRRGFRQVTKSLMRKEARVVFVGSDLTDNLLKIIIGLGKQFNIPVIKIQSCEDLGRIVGFEKIRDSVVYKVSKCGTASIVDFVEESEGRYFLENALRDKINE